MTLAAPLAAVPVGASSAVVPPRTVTVTENPVPDVLVPIIAAAGAIVVAFLVASLIGAGVRATARRWPPATDLSRRARRPLRLLLSALGVAAALALTTTDSSWTPVAYHTLLIVVLIAVGWLLVQVSFVAEDSIVARYPVDVPDNRHARRVRTQVQVLRRLTAAAIVLVVGAVILFTFPGMRAVGASLLASAGLVSIIAGLAAQTSLANVFAGMQIAFTDALRVDDVVVVEGEWGRIEEITMTYVVVQIWDDRRLVLPSTYFTTTPFQNWTRRASELLGTVELDVDWTVPIEALRGEMERLLDATELWDRRVGIIQVTEATGGTVRVRALASAVSAPILWDLRCYLREGLVAWLQQSGTGLPRTRLETVPRAAPAPAILPGGDRGARGERAGEAPTPPAGEAAAPRSAAETGLFSGTADALERSRVFTGPVHERAREDGQPGTPRRAEEETSVSAVPSAVPPAVPPAPRSGPPATPPAAESTDVLPRVERRSTRRRATGEGGGTHGEGSGTSGGT